MPLNITKNYFFCLSYSNVFKILSIIEKYNLTSSDIIIIVNSHSHQMFWQELIKENKLRWSIVNIDLSVRSHRNIKNWFHNKIILKRLYNEYFRDLVNSNIYFFSVSFSLHIFVIIQMLSKRNTILFSACDDRPYPIYDKNLYFLFKKLLRLYYNTDIEFVNINNKAIPRLTQRFFIKNKIRTLLPEELPYNVTLYRKYDSFNLNYMGYKKIIFLHDDCYLFATKSSDKTKELLKTISEKIQYYYLRDEIIFKRHPNENFHSANFNDIYSIYPEYPYYIPADFMLLNENVKYIIGGFSTILCLAAQYFGVKAVSYLNLIEFDNLYFKNQIRSILRNESKNKIILINSVEDLDLLFAE